MRLFLIFAIIAQLAVHFTLALPINPRTSKSVTQDRLTRRDDKGILSRRGYNIFKFGSSKAKVAPEPAPASTVSSPPPATPPAPVQASSPPRPSPVQPASQAPIRKETELFYKPMSRQEKNRLLAQAHGHRARQEVRAGAKAYSQYMKDANYRAGKQYLNAKMNFQKSSKRKGLVQFGNTAKNYVKGASYATVPLANGLYHGLKSSATSMRYRANQWRSNSDQMVRGNPGWVRSKAGDIRGTTPGYRSSSKYMYRNVDMVMKPTIPKEAPLGPLVLIRRAGGGSGGSLLPAWTTPWKSGSTSSQSQAKVTPEPVASPAQAATSAQASTSAPVSTPAQAQSAPIASTNTIPHPTGKHPINVLPGPMKAKEAHGRMADAYAVRAGREVVAGTRGTYRNLRYTGKQVYKQTGLAMQQFGRGNFRQGFRHLGGAAKTGFRGSAYSTVPLAKGLYYGAKAGGTSMKYKVQQWRTSPRVNHIDDPTLIRAQAASIRTTVPGYSSSKQYMKDFWTGKPKVAPSNTYTLLGADQVPIGPRLQRSATI